MLESRITTLIDSGNAVSAKTRLAAVRWRNAGMQCARLAELADGNAELRKALVRRKNLADEERGLLSDAD